MATKKQEQYGNSSISMLKGEDRVRKRPAVIFQSPPLVDCFYYIRNIPLGQINILLRCFSPIQNPNLTFGPELDIIKWI